MSKKDIQHWGVCCYINGEHVLTIESNSVCGRTLSDQDEEAIRNMAEHLLAFVGSGKDPQFDFITGEPVEGNSTGSKGGQMSEAIQPKPSGMGKCCTVDNLEQSSSDGSLEACVNVLVCKTCHHQESYVYANNNKQNALFSYCQFVAKRIELGLPVFSARQFAANR